MLTVGLLGSGFSSTLIGRLADRYGGRTVMSVGSVLAAIGLLLLSQARNEWAYLAAWAVLGPAMRMTLYDAAFAALVQVTPSRGRRARAHTQISPPPPSASAKRTSRNETRARSRSQAHDCGGPSDTAFAPMSTSASQKPTHTKECARVAER